MDCKIMIAFACLLYVELVSGTVNENFKKVCSGTDIGTSRPTDSDVHYQTLKNRFTNCTYVEGNLEISWLTSRNYDLSFLEDITEVTGYVFILLVYSDVCPLTNLRIIRGTTLYNNRYALYVSLNYHTHDNELGLQELQMPKLNAIVAGEVKFVNNFKLCYVNTIQWDDLRAELVPEILLDDQNLNCSSSEYNCHSSCESGSCWGTGADMCQILTLKPCSETCDHRCRGPTPAGCCHRSCAGGCFDSTERGCYACLHFINDNQCVSWCPPRQIYNPQTFQAEDNPNFRFEYGFRCVDSCPANVLEEYDNCVEYCKAGKRELDGQCVECDDATCGKDKECKGLKGRDILYGGDFTNGSLTNCTVIKGNILIAPSSFYGDVFEGEFPVTMEQLELLSTVKEITGYLSIQEPGINLNNLSFLRNLEKIGGRDLYRRTASFSLLRTNLMELELPNLQTIQAGDVVIRGNRDLCYITSELFEGIMVDSSQQFLSNSRNSRRCERIGHVCHAQCKPIGCWGPRPDQCAECANAQYDSMCLPSCYVHDLGFRLYVKQEGTSNTPELCAKCDDESHTCCGRV